MATAGQNGGSLAWAAGLVVLLALPGLAGCAADPRPVAAPAPVSAPGVVEAPIARELALATFDSAWSRINHSYYDPEFRGLDWAGVRAELRPRAEGAATVRELRQVIGDMLGRLGESHFALIPREAVDALDTGARGTQAATGDVGLELRWVEEELTVVRVEPGSAAEAAGVRAGWVIEAIGERQVADWKQAIASAETDAARRGVLVGTLSAAAERLRGAEGSPVRVRFRDGEERAVEPILERRPVRGEPVRLGNLPAFFSYLEHRRVPLSDEGCAGVIRFNVWMVPLSAEFDRAVDALSGCHGLVIDLRGNPGGVGGMVMSTAGSFFGQMVPLGVMTTRQGEVRFVAMPRRIATDGRPRAPFAGPLAILVDEQSMSTSELFAAGMQATGRSRVFGRATPGYALPALMVRLPNQDVLYHAIANLTDPHGRRIEGAGVVPDEPVALTRADLLAGRDRALEAALAWIGMQPARVAAQQ